MRPLSLLNVKSIAGSLVVHIPGIFEGEGFSSELDYRQLKLFDGYTRARWKLENCLKNQFILETSNLF